MTLFTQRAAGRMLAASLFPILVGCSSVERALSGPTATFQGGAAVQFVDVPAPDPTRYALGELDIRVNSDLIAPEHRKELGKLILATVGGRFKPWTTRDKEPQFRMVINQINSQQDWEGSNTGALIAGVGGAAAGASIDDNTWRGAVIGGAAGAGLGYVVFGEERNAWAFNITVTQSTSEAERDMAATRADNASFQGGVAGGGSVSTGSQRQDAVDNVRLKFKSGLYTYGYACVVSVEAGPFSGRGSIEEAARKKLLERLPEAMLGGGEVNWAQ